MFEAVKVDISNQWFDLTPGQLAELLVFYDRVELIAPISRLESLIGSMSLDDVRFLGELCSGDSIKITVDQFSFGDIAVETGILGGLGAQAFFHNDSMTFQPPNLRVTGKKTLNEVEFGDMRDLIMWQLVVNNQHRMDCPDKELKSALRPIVEHASLDAAVGYDKERLEKVGQSIRMAMDKDWLQTFLRQYFVVVEGHEPQKAQAIASALDIGSMQIGEVSYPRLRSPHLGAGEYIGPISLLCVLNDTWLQHDALDSYAHPAALRLSMLLSKQAVRKLTPDRDIAIFADVKLAGRRIAETIDNGERPFREVRNLLERRELFAKVVRGKPADMTMAEWYIRESTRGFATGSLAKRLARFGAFTAPGVLLDIYGAGGLGTAAGVAISASDSLLLDHLVAKTKPHVFVDESIPEWMAVKVQ